MTRENRLVKNLIQKNQAINNYSHIHYLYKNGYISEDLWNQFCLACLETLMGDSQEVLKRLKNI